MDWNSIFQSLLRWLHVLAGIMWIGQLYFFNFVNAGLAKTYDADSKKKVVPELIPRVLYFFRWGAAYTWLTGFLLLGMIYYGGHLLVDPNGTVPHERALISSVLSIVVVFFIYDGLWKLIKNETVGVIISFLLIVAYLYLANFIFIGRALWIHLGVLFGTIMMLNVWMRIWPGQKKVIAGIKGTGPAPDASVPAMVALRSKHNVYMSIPLVFMMISNHYPTIYGETNGWIWAVLLVILGWLMAKFLYFKAASPVVLDIGDQSAAPKA